jgi:probable F420-dependent oxidoreductase
VKFGLNLINFGPNANPASVRGSALWAEEVGFHVAMVSDHVAVTPDVAQLYPAPFYEPFTTLAWLSGLTSRIALGTTVIVLAYRHPLLTGRMVANLDQLSGGRLVLGIGAGWARAEFEALGVPFERRGQLTDDYLAALKAHWSDEVASVGNSSVRFQNVHTNPRPLRLPHPPLWVGGQSTAAIRRAARYGDAWHPLNARLDWLTDTGLPLLRRAADDEHRAVPEFAPRLRVRLSESSLPDAERHPGQGTLDQIRHDLEALATLGATWVVFDTYHGRPEELAAPETARQVLEVLADKVLDLPRQTLR